MRACWYCSPINRRRVGARWWSPSRWCPVSALGLRAYPNFLLHHDVAQRNAVLQPLWLSYLLKHRMVHQWVIACVHTWILGRLDAYWHALDQHAMVMTPRRRAPFADWQQLPTEQTALQQGIFNLDLLGLRRDEQAQHIVDWWIDNTAALHAAPDYALLDLLPRLQQGLGVVRAPQYGVSFWNLHERKLEAVSDALRVDGAALRCAQFAGFDAFDPATLSAQQTRHDVRLNPALTQLTQHYAAQLMAHGYRAWHAVPNHYDTLSNGVPVTPLIRKVLAMGAQRRIEIPSCAQAEVFCQFLMTPNPLFNGDEVAPVLAAILPLRRDVRAGFTRFDGSLDVVGVATWFQQCGQYEHDCVMLCTQYGQWLTRFSAFVRLQALLQHRADLTQRYPNPLSRQQFPAFAAWLREHASDEADFTADEIAVLIAAADVGRNKIVELYMASEQLLDAFPHALVVGDKTFVRWLFTDGCGPLPISVAEVYWFQEQRDHDSDFALWYLAARHPAVRERLPLAATAFGWPMYMQWLAGQNKPDGTEPPTALPVPTHLSRLAQLELLANSAGYRDAHAHAFETPSALQEFARTALPQQTQLSRADRQAFACAAAEYTPQYGVNVAGYFSYHAGLGESVRGFVQSLHTADIPHRKVFVPLFSQNNRLPDDWWKSWHAPEYRTSIIVINPDHFARAKRYLSPTFFGGRRNVAFWVWETERLPSEMAEAAAGLHAIWTASHYCARSIAASVGASTPVHVVPHGIDIPEELPVAHRQAWGIPAGHVAFGFFFDARSTFERKNPEALVRAFRQAFTAQDRVVLVLKINHGTDAPEQRARLARMADGLPVIFIDQRLSPLQMQRLVMSLDVYVSLHRAEGFGLTMAEAMALGKPIVATGYSGNLDFMDDACARLVSYTLIETDQAHGPYGRGSCWADPSVEHAAGLLRQLYDDAELRHHLGAQGRRRVTQTLSYQAVGARYQAHPARIRRGADAKPSGGPSRKLILAGSRRGLWGTPSRQSHTGWSLRGGADHHCAPPHRAGCRPCGNRPFGAQKQRDRSGLPTGGRYIGGVGFVLHDHGVVVKR